MCSTQTETQTNLCLGVETENRADSFRQEFNNVKEPYTTPQISEIKTTAASQRQEY